MSWFQRFLNIFRGPQETKYVDVTDLGITDWFKPAHAEPTFVGNLAAVDVKPGDVFVLMTDEYLPEPSRKAIQKWWDSEKNPLRDHKMLVVPSGMKLGVVRKN